MLLPPLLSIARLPCRAWPVARRAVAGLLSLSLLMEKEPQPGWPTPPPGSHSSARGRGWTQRSGLCVPGHHSSLETPEPVRICHGKYTKSCLSHPEVLPIHLSGSALISREWEAQGPPSGSPWALPRGESHSRPSRRRLCSTEDMLDRREVTLQPYHTLSHSLSLSQGCH